MKKSRLSNIVFVGIIGLLALLSTRIFSLIPGLNLKPSSNPNLSYEDALKLLAKMQGHEGPEIDPVCCTTLLTHGHKVEKAIVLLHGIPNCPAQFLQLGQMYYDRGYNVLIPRMPHSGMADKMTHELINLTAEELVAYANEVTNIARTMGDNLTVVGLSAGGVIASYIAHFRPDVERVAILAPAFSIYRVPPFFYKLAVLFFYRFPNQFLKRPPEAVKAGPPQVGFYQSSRSIGQIMRLGMQIMNLSRRNAPAVKSLLLVTSAGDTVVDNKIPVRLAAQWRAQGAQVQTYEFPPEQGVIHDMIEPNRTDNKVDIVYPKLLELI